MDPVTYGIDGTFDTGRFGSYGLVYLDNIRIGETAADLLTPVDPQQKLSTAWAALKTTYSRR